MSEEELYKICDELKERFGDLLPNPEHQPKIFSQYVKFLKYYKDNNLLYKTDSE